MIVLTMPCQVIESSHIIGKKWSIPIMEELEEVSLVEKKLHTKDNRTLTEYVLTKKGAEFHKLISDIKMSRLSFINIFFI